VVPDDPDELDELDVLDVLDDELDAPPLDGGVGMAAVALLLVVLSFGPSVLPPLQPTTRPAPTAITDDTIPKRFMGSSKDARFVAPDWIEHRACRVSRSRNARFRASRTPITRVTEGCCLDPCRVEPTVRIATYLAHACHFWHPRNMAGMSETCTVCGRGFEVQFRYQMEERDNAFSFFCSQACHGKSLRGETTSGVVCDCCNKRFSVELVSQVVRIKGEARYACSEGCRGQLLQEAGGVRLGAMSMPAAVAPPRVVTPSPAPVRAVVPVPAPAPAPAPTISAPAPIPTPPISTIAPAATEKKLAAPKRLAVFNHKGGTGKTTTTVSIAAGLAMKGYKVLLVDTDSQGNVGVSLGVKAERTLYHVLVMGLKPQDVAVKVRENLDLVPSNETLAAAELYLAGRQNRDRILKDRLAAAAGHYDVIILDCSPSLSLLNQNSLVFADGIMVPVACDFLSLVGVRQVIKTVKNVNSLLHHPVQIYGVLPTFYDSRARICRDAWGTMKEHFGDRCFSPVRATTKIKEAPAQGKTIFEYAPDSHAASDYQRVVERLITGHCAEMSDDDERAEDDTQAMTG
jgi:chromosome partitioning protein